jgi:phosphate transport system substrate-binding protein
MGLLVKRTHAVGAAMLAGLVALALAACGSDNNAGGTSSAPASGATTPATAATTPGVALSGTLNGGGSSAQANAQKAWVAGFQTANSGATVNYSSTDSGSGRTGFIQGSLDFAGSDAALSTDELTKAQARCSGGSAIDLPVYVSPIAVAFNLPGVTTLNLKPDVVAKIFSGAITTWNDPAITADNAGVSALTGPITVAHRSDDSGTSKNFQDYLSKVAPAVWTYKVGNTWPVNVGQGGNGTQGVVQILQGGTGTIGYIDASALGKLGAVALGVGTTFVPPTADAAAKAVDASPLDTTRAANDIVVNIDRKTTAAGAYPAVLVSYLVVCNTYDTQAKADLVKGYATYVASTAGQTAAASAAGSAPISSDLSGKVTAAIGVIKGKA